MKNMLKVMNDVTDFILGKEEESLLDKKKKTIGFVADGVKPKRKYRIKKEKEKCHKEIKVNVVIVEEISMETLEELKIFL